MRPIRCLPLLWLALACSSNVPLTTDAGCTGIACAPAEDGAAQGTSDAAPAASDAAQSPADTPQAAPDAAQSPVDAPQPADQRHEQSYELNLVRDLDILFVLGNSPSMMEEQGNLRRNFSVLMDELRRTPGGMPDLHLGVVSSDLGAGSKPLANGVCPRSGGDRGILQTKPSCGLDGSSLFLSSLANETMNNFQGSIETVFSCMANLGTAGCRFQHPLQATRVALYETVTRENTGFLRDNAYLAIILLSDQDDCSGETTSDLFVDDASFPMTAPSFRCAQGGHLCDGKAPPVDLFETALDRCVANPRGRLIAVKDIAESILALKKRPPQQILVSGLIGWPNFVSSARYRYLNTNQGLDVAPICQGANGEATPALRLKAFIDSFGASGALYGICQDDYAPAMQQIGRKLAARLSPPCISAPLVDTAPDPGVQPDCQVIDRVLVSNTLRDEPLPPCSSGTRSAGGACWQPVQDPTCDVSGFRIGVDRGGRPAPAGLQTVRCLTCTSANDPRCRR